MILDRGQKVPVPDVIRCQAMNTSRTSRCWLDFDHWLGSKKVCNIHLEEHNKGKAVTFIKN